MNVRALTLAGAIAGTAFGGSVSAQPLFAPHHPALRAPAASDRNLRAAYRRLEGTIDQLQRDQRDYGGHRVRAIADLESARGELAAALQDDRGR